MIGLVKYECGCIGFPPDNGNVVLVSCCDDDIHSDPLTMQAATPLRAASIALKKFNPLDPKENLDVIQSIGELIHEGYKFRRIQSLLKL